MIIMLSLPARRNWAAHPIDLFRPSHDDKGNLLSLLERIISDLPTNKFSSVRPIVVAEIARIPMFDLEGIGRWRKSADQQRRNGRGIKAGGMAMPPRKPPNDAQRRLLRIIARMPLASAANLAPILDLSEDRIRRMLGTLKSGGWVASVMRGMTERRQRRFFLTSNAVDLLYATDHQHPSPWEEARAAGLAAFHPQGELSADFRERFTLDHDHPIHLESHAGSPFNSSDPVENGTHYGADGHEHPPWTATSRGLAMSLRRLAMLESVYRLTPDLLRSGRVSLSSDNTVAAGDVRMTDFRLLRYGGFYHAVARYGEDFWTTFTYAGVHATERVLRRKEQHRFWGVDCYSSEEDRCFRIGNRLFYEDPDQEVEPSAQVVIAADAWAGELARSTLSGNTPTLFCTPDGVGTPTVELRPSRDLVSDPAGHPTLGKPEAVNLWLRDNPDMAAIDGPAVHRLFLAVCQFPAMKALWLAEVVGGNASEIRRHLRRFVETGLVAVFDGRHYLSELGMRRAANMSRVLPGIIKSRHGLYLDRWYREWERHHDDGVNRLVVQFAREGVQAVAGWRGEVNVPDLTQVRPDLLVLVVKGPFGKGAYYLEFERRAVLRRQAVEKLGPYRKMAGIGRALPLLMVCETDLGEESFRAAAGRLPMLTATLERALSGPLTGGTTVWRRDGAPTALHAR